MANTGAVHNLSEIGGEHKTVAELDTCAAEDDSPELDTVYHGGGSTAAKGHGSGHAVRCAQ